MAKLVSDALDECSRMLVNHKSWGYLDCLTEEKQLDVIQNYTNTEKYIVVVFEKDEQAEKHFERCEKIELNQED